MTATRSGPGRPRRPPTGPTWASLEAEAEVPALGVAGWLPWACTALAVAGVAVATYLTLAHYTNPALLACSDRGTINCAKVTTSAQSAIIGIPVAVLGLAWFLAMVALSLPMAWRAGGSPGRWLARLRLAAVVAGIGFVLYLVSAELLVIGAICLWCTTAHVLAFALFVLVAAGTAQRAQSQAGDG